MDSWNHSQSSVVTVTWATLRRCGSILPMILYSASLNGSAVVECSIWALKTEESWSREGFGNLARSDESVCPSFGLDYEVNVPPIGRFDPVAEVVQEARVSPVERLVLAYCFVQGLARVARADEVEQLGPQRLTSYQLSHLSITEHDRLPSQYAPQSSHPTLRLCNASWPRMRALCSLDWGRRPAQPPWAAPGSCAP